MLTKLKTHKTALFFAVSFAVLLFVAFTPLFFEGVVSGDDYEFHLSRVKNIAEGLKNGDFAVKIHPESLNGFGYGNGLFYPNFFLFIPAWLMVAGLSFEVSYKIFTALLIIATLFSGYFSAKIVFKDKVTPCLVTLLYFSSQAIFTNIYGRIAIGESLASVFIPVIIAALYDIVYDNFSRPYLLIIGFLGMVFSHTISLFLSVIISAIYLAFHFKRLFLSKEKPKNYGLKAILKIALCAVLVLLLSICYWLPMLEQFAADKFQVSNPWTHVGENALDIYALFSPYRPGVGLILLILAICFVDNPENKKTLSLHYIYIGLAIALITTKVVKWDLFNETIFNTIQFPWRLIPFSAAFLSFGVSGCLKNEKNGNKVKKTTVAIMVFALLFTANNALIAKNKINSLSDDIVNGAWALGWGEWMPEGTDKSKLDFQGFVKPSDGDMIKLTEKTGTTVKFNIDDKKTEHFDVPLLYYRGYSAVIETEDGETQQLQTVRGENNVVRVVNDGVSGEVCVSYTGTKIQNVAYGISTVVLVLSLGFALYIGLKKKKHREDQ